MRTASCRRLPVQRFLEAGHGLFHGVAQLLQHGVMLVLRGFPALFNASFQALRQAAFVPALFAGFQLAPRLLQFGLQSRDLGLQGVDEGDFAGEHIGIVGRAGRGRGACRQDRNRVRLDYAFHRHGFHFAMLRNSPLRAPLSAGRSVLINAWLSSAALISA